MKVYAHRRYAAHTPTRMDRLIQRLRIWIFGQRQLLQNKLCALVLVGIGALAASIEGDATALVLFLFFAVPMFFSKKDWFL